MKKLVSSFLFLFIVLSLTPPVFGEKINEHKLMKLTGEILEVEELKEPLGNAIYTIKDLSSGATIKLLADVSRSTIKIGDSIKAANDMLGGSKVVVIYQKPTQAHMPEIVFAKVTSSPY